MEIRELRAPLRLGDSPRDAANHLANPGMGRAVLATIPEPLQTRALADVRDVLADHQTGNGVEFDGGILLTHAQLRPR